MKRIIKPDKIDVLFQTVLKLIIKSHLTFDKIFFLQQNLCGFMEAFCAGPRRCYPKQMDNLKSFEKKLMYNLLLSFFFPLNKIEIIKRRDCAAAE